MRISRESLEREAAIQAVCSGEEFTVARIPSEHAGGKWRLRYESGMGAGGNLAAHIFARPGLPEPAGKLNPTELALQSEG